MLERKVSANGRTWTPAAWLEDVVRTLPESELPPPPPDPVEPKPDPARPPVPQPKAVPPTARGSVVVVVGAAAGVGKTTVALQLAAALVAETAKRVVLVDLDMRMGTVGTVLGLQPERDVGTALDALDLEDDGQLLTHLCWATGGFQVLPAPGPERARSPEPSRVASLLERLARHHDYVVVDSPPTADPATTAALDAAETVLLLATPEPRSLRASAAYVAQLGERGFPLEKLKLVLNRARAKDGRLEVELPILARIAEDVSGARSGWREGTELGRSVRGLVRLLWQPPSSAPTAAPPAALSAPPARGTAALPKPLWLGGGAAVMAAGLAAFLLLGRADVPSVTVAAAGRSAPISTIAPSPTTRVEPTVTTAPQPTATRAPLPTAVAAVAAAPPPASTTMPTAGPITTPPKPTRPPRTLFEERFADNARGWPSDRRSTAWLADGAYHLHARTPGRFVAVAPSSGPVLRDAAVTATFRKTGGPAGGGYGIVLRAQSPLDGDGQGGRYYVLEVGDRGEVGAWRREDDRWVDLLPWTPAAAVKVGGETNRLTARAHGSRLTLVVNDQIVADLEDTELKEGRVGVFVGGDGNEVVLERLQLQAAD